MPDNWDQTNAELKTIKPTLIKNNGGAKPDMQEDFLKPDYSFQDG
jgi:hypothetical protein